MNIAEAAAIVNALNNGGGGGGSSDPYAVYDVVMTLDGSVSGSTPELVKGEKCTLTVGSNSSEISAS